MASTDATPARGSICRSPAPPNSLAKLVQSLPQELYDEIYKLTFTAEPNAVVDIEAGKTFPAVLHVDPHSRKTFAESYFPTTKFTFNYHACKHMMFIFPWVGGLSEHHYHLIRSVVAKVDMHLLLKSGRTYIQYQKIFAAEVATQTFEIPS